MTTEPERTGEGPDQQVLSWLIALQERPQDDGLRACFDAWRAADAANAAAWEEARHVWRLIGEATPMEAPRRRPVSRRGLVAGLCAGALAACIMLAALPSIVLSLRSDFATGAGESRNVSLPDGSVMHLAAGSAVRVDFGSARRQIGLLAGEAFFEVAADARRPFTVEIGGVAATALGTAFNVRLAPDRADVAVRHGVVRVDYAARTPPYVGELQPGESVTVAWSGEVSRKTVPPGQVAAWMQGWLVVNDRRIGEVVDILRRYHRGAIVFTDWSLTERRITGAYDLTKPDDALAAVADAHGMTLRRITPWLVLLGGA